MREGEGEMTEWAPTEYGYEVSGKLGDLGCDTASLAAARNECGWHVTPVAKCRFKADSEATARLVQLPCTHVESVESVEVAGVPVVFDWKPNGLLRIPRKAFGDGWGDIVVVYTAGVKDADAFMSVVNHNAASIPSGVQSESAGGVSVTYSSDSAQAAPGVLSEREKSALWPYRRVEVA